MSHHDDILRRARRFLADEEPGATPGALIYMLDTALRQEIAAHDETRDARNAGTKRVLELSGNMRGLEAKVSALQAELEGAKRDFGHSGATSYHEGYLAGLVAAKAAIEALEK